jgi:hypothetical protein
MSSDVPQIDREHVAAVLKNLIVAEVLLYIWHLFSLSFWTHFLNVFAVPTAGAFVALTLFYATRLYSNPAGSKWTSEISTLVGVAVGLILTVVQISSEAAGALEIAIPSMFLVPLVAAICAQVSRTRAKQALVASQQVSIIVDSRQRDELAAVQQRMRNHEARTAIDAFVPELRKHWAKCHEFVGEQCPLKRLNDTIESARTDPSPVSGLHRLRSLHDDLSRAAVRITTEQYYEQLEPYIEAIVPRKEFGRLMQEARTHNSTAQEYGNKLIDLGEWLGSIAGPAKGRWEQRQQEQHAAAYERLFREMDDSETQLGIDQERREDSPYEDEEERTRESRAG